jgi:ubiquinol-cytochrome c reductase cytochrome b subunit
LSAASTRAQSSPSGPALLRVWGGHLVPRALGRCWFALGAAPTILLGIQLATGIVLALHYQPGSSAADAYESVRRISEEVSFGWYVRGAHRFAATLMVLTALLHQLRVLLTHSYLGPRRASWLLGCGLLGLTIAAAFTGDGLSGEARGHWALVVGGKLLGSVPVVGASLSRLLLGGEGVGEHTLARLYALHALALPFGLLLLLGLHLALVRAQGCAGLEPPRTPDARPIATEGAVEEEDAAPHETHDAVPFWPEHARLVLGVALGLLLLLNVLATAAPVAMGPVADPLVTPRRVEPLWFLLPAMSAVRQLPQPVALVAMGAAALGVLGWPYFGPRLARSPGQRDVAALLFILGLLLLAGLGIWETLRPG